MIMSFLELDDELKARLIEQINKVINIPFLNENQEAALLNFLISLLTEKLNKLKGI